MESDAIYKLNIMFVCTVLVTRHASLIFTAPHHVVIFGLSDSRIFPHYLINGPILGKKLFVINYVPIFSTHFVWNISHSKKNSATYWHKCTHVFTYSTHCCQSLIKLEFSRPKLLEYHIPWNPSIGSRDIPCLCTDMTKLMIAFRNSANAPKMN
jgi:hypothetical protein